MAQNENYSQVDLRVGTEEQFNAKVGTLPAGTLFGTTDSTVSKADLSTDLKNEINGKINKPANPTSDSAVVINSSGTVSTKPLSSITGKAEVAVSSTTPLNDEILWINPNGTSGTSIASKAIMLCSNNGNVKLNAGSDDEYILPTTEAGVPKFKLGSGNFKFEEIWSKTFNGDLDGTATRAFKADAVKTEADYRGYSPYKTIVRGLYACILRTQASEYQTVMLSIVDLNVDTYGRGAYYDGKTNEGVQYNGTSHQIRSTNEEALTLVEVRLITSY